MFSQYFYRNFKNEMDRIVAEESEKGNILSWDEGIVKTFESLHGFETRLKGLYEGKGDTHYLVITRVGVPVSCCGEDRKVLMEIGSNFIFKETDINSCPICNVERIKKGLGASRTIRLKDGKEKQGRVMDKRGFPEISKDEES